jgi:hypothetical protein
MGPGHKARDDTGKSPLQMTRKLVPLAGLAQQRRLGPAAGELERIAAHGVGAEPDLLEQPGGRGPSCRKQVARSAGPAAPCAVQINHIIHRFG